MLEQFKNKIKKIEAQVDEILGTPSLGRKLLLLIKKSVFSTTATTGITA